MTTSEVHALKLTSRQIQLLLKLWRRYPYGSTDKVKIDAYDKRFPVVTSLFKKGLIAYSRNYYYFPGGHEWESTERTAWLSTEGYAVTKELLSWGQDDQD